MKILLYFIGLLLVSIIKKKHKDSGMNLNVQDYYNIKYKKYENINTTILYTETERKIFSIFENTTLNGEKINVRVMGGWVRDKLLNLHPNDIDLEMDCMTLENLNLILNNTFEKIKEKYGEHVLLLFYSFRILQQQII